MRKAIQKNIGKSEVEAFLTDLAVTRKVSASTQNQAKSALLFLYKVEQAKAPKRLPVVLTPEETRAVFLAPFLRYPSAAVGL